MRLVATTAQVRAIDRRCATAYGLPTLALMENAGAAVASTAMRRLGRGGVRAARGRASGQEAPRVVAVCGKGQNGGDGFVAARHLAGAGCQVAVYLVAAREQVEGDARVNLEVLQRAGLTVRELAPPTPAEASPVAEFWGALQRDLAGADLAIDALLGTGFRGPVRGDYRQAIEAINGAGCPVLAVDLPSGVAADTGQAGGEGVKATVTVTFGLLKPGLLLHPGAGLAGQVRVAGIGIPPQAVVAEEIDLALIDAGLVGPLAPRRAPDAHKGTAGHLLVLAGSPGFTGAAVLCSTSALRAGAGLVTLAIGQSLVGPMAAKLTEVMTLPLPERPAGGAAVELAPEAAAGLLTFAARAQAMAIGPGLGLRATALVRELLPALRVPVVLDADGVRAYAGEPHALRHALEAGLPSLVLTPHPGEMAALLGTTTEEVQADRLAAAREAARRTGAVVVLKGAPTIVADPGGNRPHCYINTTGNPALATAGSGDVLTGLVGALLAQRLGAREAALLGVWAHGRAADRPGREVGTAGLLAGEVATALPRVLKDLRSGGSTGTG